MDPAAKSCPNCGQPLDGKALYCPSCGQKFMDTRITVREFFSEFFQVVFNLDNKIFRSLRALLVPGKLTVEYFNGRVRRYFHPIRMFLVLGILLLIVLGSVLKSVEEQLAEEVDQSTAQSYGFYLALHEADSLATQYKSIYPDSSTTNALDSLIHKLGESPNHSNDTIDIGTMDFSGLTFETNLRIARKDIYEMPIDTLCATYGITNFWQQLFVRQQIRFVTQGSKFIPFILGNMIWVVMVMMPFLALLLKVFYIRRKYYYVEHLIFSFHTHSFVFLATAVFILASQFLPEPIWIIYVIGIPVYFIIALRRVYQQKWIKTLLKALFLSVGYNIIIILFLILSLLLGFLIF